MNKNFYNILGINNDANNNHIKNAFRKLSLQFHPDRTGGNGDKFKEVNEAYQILGDNDKRREYQMRGKNPFVNFNRMNAHEYMKYIVYAHYTYTLNHNIY